jgi:hypothetical protein
MEEPTVCVLCGDVIDVGQAWMEADQEGARVRAHAECLYRDETDPLSEGWVPQEHAAD